MLLPKGNMDKFASVRNRNYTANPTQPLLHGLLDLSVDHR